MKRLNKNIIFRIMLVLLCMIAIFLLSSENGSASDDTSKKVTESVLKLTDKDSDAFYNNHIVIIRKSAHMLEYTFLGFLLMNVKQKVSKKTLIICIIIACLYACTDEFHQYFIADRSASVIDILIDTIGACIGSMVYYLIARKKLSNK